VSPVPPAEAPYLSVFSLLAGGLPDREKDRPRTVQRGVQGHLPAGQEDGGSEESAGELEVQAVVGAGFPRTLRPWPEPPPLTPRNGDFSTQPLGSGENQENPE
jgi:hypothetical protein